MNSRLEKAAIDGLIAGLPMAMFAMVAMLFRGQSVWRPIRMMAGAVEGRRAVGGGIWTVLVGVMIHVTTSMIVGALFVPFLRIIGWRRGRALPLVGAIYGTLVWAFNEGFTLPLVDPMMARRFSRTIFGISHLVYGTMLGALLNRLGPHLWLRPARTTRPVGVVPPERRYVA